MLCVSVSPYKAVVKLVNLLKAEMMKSTRDEITLSNQSSFNLSFFFSNSLTFLQYSHNLNRSL